VHAVDGWLPSSMTCSRCGQVMDTMVTTTALLLARPPAGHGRRDTPVTHLFPVPEAAPDELRALRGATFTPGDLEALDRPQGMPCTACLTRAPRAARDHRLDHPDGAGAALPRDPQASRRPGYPHATETPARLAEKARIPERARGARTSREGRNARATTRRRAGKDDGPAPATELSLSCLGGQINLDDTSRPAGADRRNRR
jgi:hypothetical protein